MKALCKKNSPYVYFDAEFIDKIDYDYKIKCEQYEEKIEALNSEILRNGV